MASQTTLSTGPTSTGPISTAPTSTAKMTSMAASTSAAAITSTAATTSTAAPTSTAAMTSTADRTSTCIDDPFHLLSTDSMPILVTPDQYSIHSFQSNFAYDAVGQMGSSSNSIKATKKKKIKASIRVKEARNAGEGYFTVKGKYTMPKVFKYQECSCKNDCKSVTSDDRLIIFEEFWATKSWQCQQNFILTSVIITEPKRHFVQDSRKKNSRTFILKNQRVCKSVFLETLGISNKRLDYCLTKKNVHNICSPDKRGQATPNKTSEEKILQIRQFLDSIPKYSSHNTNSTKLYFKQDLTRVKLFEEYKKTQFEKGRIAVSKPIFYRIFKDYNIEIYIPKSDTRQQCDAEVIKLLHCSTDEKTKRLDLHLERAEKARECLNLAKAGAS